MERPHTGAAPGGPSHGDEDRDVGTLVDPVKLVIWDIDDTLWTGTLSEGPVALPQGRADLVRTLNRRGIVNAICSKNDPDPVWARLAEEGLADQFVFASIDWTPKGARVARIIEDMQLRPPNVLFLDDLALNREEAHFHAEGLQTGGPELIDRLLDLPQLAGKDDSGLTRLEQYRTLERKQRDRVAASEGGGEGANEAFLRSCQITIGIFEEAAPEAARLHELSLRTNQLNFTKRRLDEDEFTHLLTDPRYRTGYVQVRDRYGEYGICGFYAVDREQHVLVDFLFSCRILHMGVEPYLYNFLGRPELRVVGDVAATVDGEVDWIRRDDKVFTQSDFPTTLRDKTQEVVGQPQRVLMVGGCDLNTTAQFLGGDITTDFSHPGDGGAFIFVGHTATIRQSADGLTDAQWAVVDRLPFVDRTVFRSPIVTDRSYDILVHSVLTDYTQGLYRHRSTGLVVPWLQFNQDATDPEQRPRLLRRYAHEGMDDEFFTWFADEFEFLGGISVEQFTANITWLAGAVPDGAEILFLNGAEVQIDNPKEPDRHLHHATMNAALDATVATLDNARICDVRALVTSPEDLTDHLRHYRRQIYLGMAEQIRAAGLTSLSVAPPPLIRRAFRQAYVFGAKRKEQLSSLSRRLRGT